jgi:hypothetical protein
VSQGTLDRDERKCAHCDNERADAAGASRQRAQLHGHTAVGVSRSLSQVVPSRSVLWSALVRDDARSLRARPPPPRLSRRPPLSCWRRMRRTLRRRLGATHRRGRRGRKDRCGLTGRRRPLHSRTKCGGPSVTDALSERRPRGSSRSQTQTRYQPSYISFVQYVERCSDSQSSASSLHLPLQTILPFRGREVCWQSTASIEHLAPRALRVVLDESSASSLAAPSVYRPPSILGGPLSRLARVARPTPRLFVPSQPPPPPRRGWPPIRSTRMSS